MSSGSLKRLSTFRMVVFWMTVVCSMIVVFISASLILLTAELDLGPFAFALFGVSALTALLSKFTVINMLVVDICRRRSSFSYIVVEIVRLSILWILWLSTGSYAVWMNGQLNDDLVSPGFASCDFAMVDDSRIVPFCYEIKVVMALSFLVWILLMSYTAVLAVLAIRAQKRGNRAWTTAVRDGVLFYSARKTTGGAAQVQTALATIPYSLPPSQQHLPHQPPPQQQPYPAYPSSYPVPQV